jgi:hypothetical protein
MSVPPVSSSWEGRSSHLEKTGGTRPSHSFPRGMLGSNIHRVPIVPWTDYRGYTSGSAPVAVDFSRSDQSIRSPRIFAPWFTRLVTNEATLIIGDVLLRSELDRFAFPFLRRGEIPFFSVSGRQHIQHGVIFP